MKKIPPFVSKFINAILNGGRILKSAPEACWKDIFGVGQDLRAISKNKIKPPAFMIGEIILVTECRFGGSSSLIRLTPGVKTKLKSRHGKSVVLEHGLVIGREENGALVHVKDLPIRIRRPSLEQYVLHMKRVATPSYPKDILAILSMAEVGQGSVVLEAGTGSGAMTLFLSRAVGKEGHVHSFDSNAKHIKNGKENFIGWITSWNKTKFVQWPENVTFYDSTVQKCTERLPETCKVDAAVIDLQSPEHHIEYILQAVKQERPIIIFLPSITQVVDVIKSSSVKDLPCVVDNIIEVTHRMWKVQPVTPVDNADLEGVGRTGSEKVLTNDVQSSVKYKAKPSFQQLPHTGFILKLLHREKELKQSQQNDG